MRRQRIDKWLVEWGLVSSRTRAQELIAAGGVWYQPDLVTPSQPVTSASQIFSNEDKNHIQVQECESLRFVSRGGIKLEKALDFLDLELPQGLILDVGLSTGGFSDCLLQRGAESVLGVDVGTEQLHSSLRKDSRLTYFDQCNARSMSKDDRLQSYKSQCSMVVMDLSFISMTQVLSELKFFLNPGGVLLSLVKPQFELSKSSLNKQGVVKDYRLYENVKVKVVESLVEHNFKVLNYFESELKGKHGNQEFFVLAEQN